MLGSLWHICALELQLLFVIKENMKEGHRSWKRIANIPSACLVDSTCNLVDYAIDLCSDFASFRFDSSPDTVSWLPNI